LTVKGAPAGTAVLEEVRKFQGHRLNPGIYWFLLPPRASILTYLTYWRTADMVDFSALLVTVGVIMTWLYLTHPAVTRLGDKAEDVVTLNSYAEARGRPVAVAVDTIGALLIADDVGNTVWRVASAGPWGAAAA
jgi:hypothetical protein